MAPKDDHDLCAFAVLVGFGSFQQQLHAVVRPGEAFDVQRHQFRATQSTSEGDEQQSTVTVARETRLADLA